MPRRHHRGDSRHGQGLGPPANPKVVFIEGDYDHSGRFAGAGLLLVTGRLTMAGTVSWEEPIFAFGLGEFLRRGAGTGQVSGGIVVADISGPDRILFTADDCSGEDGMPGTSDDGMAEAIFDVDGAGNSTTGFCSDELKAWQGKGPLEIVSFRQR